LLREGNGTLKHTDQLTRIDFYMQTLTIWERLLMQTEKIYYRTGMGLQTMIQLRHAIKILKETYDFSELVNMQEAWNQINEVTNPFVERMNDNHFFPRTEI
jgi:hypothetical protein